MRAAHLTSIALTAVLAVTTARAGDFDKDVVADPHGIVEVSNFSGSVVVEAWDKPEVSVHGEFSGGVTTVDVRTDHGRTSISTRLMHGFSFGGGEADLNIKVPRGSELDVTGVSADIHSTGVLGVQRLKTVSGSITAEIAEADVDAKTVSGDVILHGKSKPAHLHVTSISGNISLEHGAGDAEATTVSGDLKMQLEPGREVRARTTSGLVMLKGQLAKDADVDAQTVSGDIKLHAPTDGGYEYEVLTFSGDIKNCLGAQAEKTSRYGPGERLSGSIGKSSGHVRLKTMSGSVDLCNKP